MTVEKIMIQNGVTLWMRDKFFMMVELTFARELLGGQSMLDT